MQTIRAIAALALALSTHAQDAPPPVQHDRPANRLAQETSPYLLQHAHNPVAWFAWGEEAFAEARRRGVPIFLSIGYSTCYWCHVMERESFEDDAVGRLMSENFVCIKVDREERPDVDDVYMTATTAMTGRGGWPMSVFLTPPGASGPDDPGLKPFWCGTYFPPEPRHGMPSFTQVLTALSRAWGEQRADILEQADALAAHVRERLGASDASSRAPVSIGADQVSKAASALLRIFDRLHGGFGGAPGQPKFPQPVFLEFLLNALPTIADEESRAAVDAAIQTTLDRMAMGGMHDQIGGGFHRYSVDERWLVPHFEKMLYDNAQLLRVYARRAVANGDAFHRNAAEEIVAYVEREMTLLEGGASGGCFSAQDAEVDGREGLNYLWTPQELDEVFQAAPDDAAFAKRVFGLDQGPNFRDPHHPEEPARNVLFLRVRPDALPAEFGMEPRAFFDRLMRVSGEMRAARDKRPQPRLDDKVIASWNGLMIQALADAGAALREPSWVAHAERAASFCWDNLRTPEGRLLRTWRGGRAKTSAMLEDHASLIAGFVALSRAGATGAPWLDRAATLAEEAERRFGGMDGALFDTPSDSADLLVRGRSMHDGAVPGAQSMMAHALLDLADEGGEDQWRERAAALLASMSRAIADDPVGSVNATRALLRLMRIDPERAARLAEARPAEAPLAPDAQGGAAGDGAAAADAEGVRTPVGVFAETDRVAVPRGGRATLAIELRIDEGWHITAHEPFAPNTSADARLPGLIGLTVRIAGGTGIRAMIEYPPGERLAAAPGGLPALLVHTGSVRLQIVLERTGEMWSGSPTILVTYQACDDSACLAPVTVELDVAIDAE